MIQFIDESIYKLFIPIINLNNTIIMNFISYLGSAVALIFIAICFFVILKNKKDAAYISLNLASVFVLNRILKWAFRRERPNILRLTEESGYSFPSGHSMVAMGFYGFLIYLVYKKVKNKKSKCFLIAFLSILILLIGLSRIYLGVHYATDVIGGFIIGAIYLVLYIKYIYNKKPKKALGAVASRSEEIKEKGDSTNE